MNSYPNKRDCEHGRQRGKCSECDLEIAETKLEQAERTLRTIAENPEWLDHHCRAKACLDIITSK